jgi:hypothetical protein
LSAPVLGEPRWREAPHHSRAAMVGSLRPAPRASPSPEVTDPFCRVPLPALFHRLEAVHPGDLMRFGYGQSPRPPDFHGPRRARRTPAGRLCALPALLRATRIRAGWPRWGDERALLAARRGVSERRRVAARGLWSRNVNRVPFRPLRSRSSELPEALGPTHP